MIIPILIAGLSWITALLNNGWPAVILSLSFLWLLRARPLKVRLLVIILFAIAQLCIPLRAASMTHSNNPPALSQHQWQLIDASVQLDFKQNSNWRASLSSTPVSVLVRADFKEKLQIGCKLRGAFRVVPSDNALTPWLLKAQANQTKSDCRVLGLVGDLRKAFSGLGTAFSKDSAALVSGLSIGDDSKLSQKAKDQMKLLSLTHLTAVSGANCAIVAGLIFLLLKLFPLRRWVRMMAAGVSLGAYVALVGPEPSVIRAAAMSGVIMFMVSTGRPTTPVAALSIAITLLLLWNPFFAGELGFALSVAATGGILLLTPIIYRQVRRKFGAVLSTAIAVSVAAQIWCLPLLLDLQHGLPTYSIIANVLVEPLVAPITVLGLLACLFAPWLPQVAQLFFTLAQVPAEIILKLAHFLAQLPFATAWWPAGLYGLALMVLLATAITISALTKARVIPLALAALVIFSFGGSALAAGAHNLSWPLRAWQVVQCNVGQGDGLVFRDGNQIAVVDVGREDGPIDDCLNRLGVRQINLLVLTHFDADHIGGIAGAIKNRTVSEVLLPDYQDDRWVAGQLTSTLEARSRVHIANAGLQGSIGQTTWTVLQPEIHGQDSEDSNDGSIAMRWDAPCFVLYTLADLGEKGQMRLVQNHLGWLTQTAKPVILKVSHHGSADQYFELLEYLHPDLALISVGVANSYGHPTKRTLDALARLGTAVYRTDLQGAISVAADAGSNQLSVSAGG